MARSGSRTKAFAPDPQAPERCCDMPGCASVAGYRAPKSRRRLRDYWWFCLDHVRAYNAAWDYYKGMGPAQIESERYSDVLWQRPTWPLGALGRQADESRLAEALEDLLTRRAPHRAGAAPPGDLREPLATLGLAWPVSLAEVKARYKELAKQHHPDRHGGDRAAEERLKEINLAYAALRARLPAVVPAGAAGPAP